jgi:hypothetical protein
MIDTGVKTSPPSSDFIIEGENPETRAAPI